MAKLLEALKAKGIEITEDIEADIMQDFTLKEDAERLKGELEKEKGISKALQEAAKAKEGEVAKLIEEARLAEKKAFDGQLSAYKLDSEIKSALTGAGAKDADLIATLIKKDDIKLGEDGKYTGLSEQVEAIKKDKGYMFENQQGYTPQAGTSTSGEVSMTDAIAARIGLN